MKTKLLFLKKYKDRLEKEIKASINLMGEKSVLRDACEYALTNGGKRLRPIIVKLIADAIGKGFDVSSAALAVEYFHTASLIADDLPSMDNEFLRRSKAALHLEFNEATALLASYTFISQGYGMVAKNTNFLCEKEKLKRADADRICVIALEEISKIAGISGATNGQFLDLFPPDKSEKTALKIIEQKTITLFELSFTLGWLFGGGSVSKLADIKKCAYHFGMAFQILDDILDMKEDKKRENELNVALIYGTELAIKKFTEEMNFFKDKMNQLFLFSKPFNQIYDLLFSTLENKCCFKIKK